MDDVHVMELVRALVDDDTGQEELQRIKTVPGDELEKAVAVIRAELKGLIDGRSDISSFLQVSQILFPMESWKDYYFLDDEVGEDMQDTGLAFEFVFENIGILRCLLPPIEPFITHLCTKYNLHSSLSTTRYNLVKPSVDQGAEEGDWMFPNEYVPLDAAVRMELSSKVKVAVLDTGIDPWHPDLKHIPKERCKDFSGSRSWKDDVGHGTHCIGILNGRGIVDSRCTGIAPGAEVYSLKIMNSAGASLESILGALDWGVGEKILIYSMSIGSRNVNKTERYDLLSAIIETLIRKLNLIICAAAGNEGCGDEETPILNSISSPGDCPSAITVGAVDSNLYLAPFSSRGSTKKNARNFEKPTLCAPGVNVVSCMASSNGVPMQYVGKTGTSMATPIVAGLCCLLYGKGLDRTGILKALSSSCTVPVDHRGRPYSRIYEVGWGVPDGGALARIIGLQQDEAQHAASVLSNHNVQPINAASIFQVANVPRRCDWSGVPLPSGAREGAEFFICEDDLSKYIHIAAYEKLKGQAEGRKLSKNGLIKEYKDSYRALQESLYSEVRKRKRATQLFQANAKRLGFQSSLVVREKEVVIPSRFFLDDSISTSERLPVVAYVAEPKKNTMKFMGKRSIRLFVLCFEAEGLDRLPDADEQHVLCWPPSKDADSCITVGICNGRRSDMTEKSCLDGEFWVIKDAASLGNDLTGDLLRDLFWLEDPNARIRRCIGRLEEEKSRYMRVSLTRDSVESLIRDFGVEFLLHTALPGFKVITKDGELIIRSE
jgi:serine protease AprX